MTLIKIGVFTINPDAIDYIEGELPGSCLVFFRSGNKLPIYMSQEEAKELILSQIRVTNGAFEVK